MELCCSVFIDSCQMTIIILNVVASFFFFKQKTAYEMRISDWSSDVCSSDLLLMTSFWSGDATILMKQAAAVGLFKTMKGAFTTAGGVHDSLKKEFTPEEIGRASCRERGWQYV